MVDISLESIGLTEGESKVYLALLSIGSSTTGKIIKEAQVSNSKIYEILDRLKKKGLVSISLINNVKHFEAKDPSNIRELVDKKEKAIEKVKQEIPKLQALYAHAEPIQEAEILEGTKGIKSFTENILSKLREGDTFYIMGAPKEATEKLGAYFKDWHQRRIEKGVKCKILYNQDASARVHQMGDIPLTEIRTMPSGIITPALIDIGKDYVGTIIFGDRPLCIIIKNQKVAESYLNYFDLLWNTC
jgi:sugar-specific transcriptional regulator TrmB